MSFIVVESGYEYDDSYYSRVSGGTPIFSFKDKKSANDRAKELTIRRIFSDGCSKKTPYCFDLENYCYEQYIHDTHGVLFAENPPCFKSTATPQEVLLFLEENGISFFHVVEVEDVE